MKKLHLSYLAAVMGLVLMTLSSCGMGHEPEASWMPEFMSSDADVQENQAVLTAVMSSSKGIVECGFLYGPSENSMKIMTADISDGGFEAVLSGLEYDAEYLWKAYACNGRNFIYSDLLTFRTASPFVEPGPEDPEDPEKYEGTLSLEYYSRYVPAESSSFSIMIGGDADFKVQMGRDGEGLRYELDGRKCTIYIDKNTSSAVRWWIIGFWRPDYESRVYVDFNITQMSPNSTIELSTHDLEIGPESGTYTIDVNRAPNKFAASATVDWIEVQYYDRLFLHVESNPFPFSRFGQVHVMDEDLNECYMNVFQEAGKKFSEL